ncbi:hypothetical protein HPB51_002618 [Rhipicephalus microplus]|uniref:HTH CENPB-type domain-containing protein n=1 Tax=Rhipicephalus microplus TaxID=6941 RepID=A0A9J6DEX8_RHIMP|nr:hypothetical protein HPB51_002618 [Rhipicephalus microplus]
MAPTVPSQPTLWAASTKRGRYTTLTMAKKAAIIQQVLRGRLQVEVAREFNISKQTILDYMKNKDKILGVTETPSRSEQKRVRQGVHRQLEEALSIWLNATVAQRVPVSGHLLKQKAETLALRLGIDGFRFSDGWLRNIKKRYNLAFKKMCESQIKYNVDLMSAVSMLADAWKAVSAGTISNCFRHAGFTLRSEPDTADTTAEEPDNATEEPDLPPSASSSGADAIDDLRGCGVPIPDTVTFEDCANVDSAVSSCAELNDGDIIEQVPQPSNSGSDSDDDDAPCAPEPSHADLSRALAVLSSSYSDPITVEEIQADLLARKRKCMQQRINDFFQPPVD